MSTLYPITVLDKPEQEKFLISSQSQRRNQISMIINKELSVTAYAVDENRNEQLSFSTQLLGINPEHDLLILDSTPNQELNEQITSAAMLYCATTINDVPVEFKLETPRQTKLADRPVFVTPLPSTLIRMQRREFFRVNIPAGISAICYFPTDSSPIKVELADISIGGFSILIHGPFPRPFEIDDILEQCEIQLSLNDNFEATLKVKNHIKKPPKNGIETTLIGFTFIDMPESIQSQIQRFIFNIESKRLRTR